LEEDLPTHGLCDGSGDFAELTKADFVAEHTRIPLYFTWITGNASLGKFCVAVSRASPSIRAPACHNNHVQPKRFFLSSVFLIILHNISAFGALGRLTLNVFAGRSDKQDDALNEL
jgi:hypothetical protein